MLDKLHPIIYHEEQEWYLSTENTIAKMLKTGVKQKKVLWEDSLHYWLSEFKNQI